MGLFNFFQKKKTSESKKSENKIDQSVKFENPWKNEQGELENYFKSFKRPIEESLISNSELFKNSLCPYCGFKLEKPSLKKTKCPNCHNYIYVRTNLITKGKMLLTEEQVNVLEAERDGIGTKVYALRTALSDYSVWIEFKKTKKQLNEENRNLSDFDILWGILNKQQMECVKKNDWGLFRNLRYGMYVILNAEKRFKEALIMSLEVCFYDINRPNNLSTTDPKILKEFPPFDSKAGFVAPALVESIKDLKDKLNLKWDDIKHMFIERANQVRMKIMLISPEKAWEILYNELYDGLK